MHGSTALALIPRRIRVGAAADPRLRGLGVTVSPALFLWSVGLGTRIP